MIAQMTAGKASGPDGGGICGGMDDSRRRP